MQWSCVKSVVRVWIVAAGISGSAAWAGTTTEIPWKTNYAEAVKSSRESGKPVYVQVSAVWCGACQQMKATTLAQPAVRHLLQEKFVPLLLDADQYPELIEQFRVEAFPTAIVVSPDLKIVKRVVGVQSAPQLQHTLQAVAGNTSRTAPVDKAQPAVSALLPENSSQFAFGGVCLVTMLDKHQMSKGKTEFTAEHQGQTLCFTSAEHRNQFLSQPEKYWPAEDGCCPVTWQRAQVRQTGSPHSAVTWRGKIWFLADEQSRLRFIDSPLLYLGSNVAQHRQFPRSRS